MSEFKLNIGGEVKIPKFLQSTGFSLSSRPHLPVDDLEGEGTALDTIRRRPGYKFKTLKRVDKQLQNAEYLREFGQKKFQESGKTLNIEEIFR